MAQVAFVDLNSFSLYPTMGIGYLTAALRAAGHSVRLISPLAAGVTFQVREPRLTWKQRVEEQLTFSGQPSVRRWRRQLSRLRDQR